MQEMFLELLLNHILTNFLNSMLLNLMMGKNDQWALKTLCTDGGCPSWSAGVSTRPLCQNRRTVCELWPRDPDPGQGGELHDQDESGNPTFWNSATAETELPEEEQPETAGGCQACFPHFKSDLLQLELIKHIALILHWIVPSSSIQFMLSENTRVRAKIQSVFEQLAVPHVAKVRCDDVKVTLQIALHIIQNYIYWTMGLKKFHSLLNKKDQVLFFCKLVSDHENSNITF